MACMCMALMPMTSSGFVATPPISTWARKCVGTHGPPLECRSLASFAIAANAARANAPRAGLLHLSCKGDGSSGQERGWLKGALAATAAALVLATAGFVPAGAPPSPANVVEMVAGPPKASNAFVEASDRKLEPSEKNTIQLFRENTPSVVFISTYIDRQDRFSLDVERVPQGQGSGFVWDKEGHIVTNYHVIRSATAASVALSDTNGKQTLYKATLVGVDPDKDTAVLKIDAPSSALRPIVRGTSSDLQVGQMALAIGNPFGLDHSLSTGVVSGLGRETASPTGRCGRPPPARPVAFRTRRSNCSAVPCRCSLSVCARVRQKPNPSLGFRL
jgi:S1-C subfamily serine protease